MNGESDPCLDSFKASVPENRASRKSEITPGPIPADSTVRLSECHEVIISFVNPPDSVRAQAKRYRFRVFNEPH